MHHGLCQNLAGTVSILKKFERRADAGPSSGESWRTAKARAGYARRVAHNGPLTGERAYQTAGFRGLSTADMPIW